MNFLGREKILLWGILGQISWIDNSWAIFEINPNSCLEDFLVEWIPNGILNGSSQNFSGWHSSGNDQMEIKGPYSTVQVLGKYCGNSKFIVSRSCEALSLGKLVRVIWKTISIPERIQLKYFGNHITISCENSLSILCKFLELFRNTAGLVRIIWEPRVILMKILGKFIWKLCRIR